MKRLLLISLIALAACNSNTGSKKTDEHKLPTSLVNNPYTAGGIDTVAAAMKPTMNFTDTLHNFGSINEEEIVSYEFAFMNNGKTPLIINSASGSCGCTVADYPRDPVPAGKGGNMKVTFNSAGKSGHQVKTVTVHTNTVQNIQMLYIQADIVKHK